MKQEKDYFLLTLDETEEIAKEVIRLAKIVKTMHLANPDNPDIIEKASELQGKAEKLTLRARVSVMYSQAPDGKALSFKNTENVIPVELAISEDGWFCMRLPMLASKKMKGNSDYIREFLYDVLTEYFNTFQFKKLDKAALIFTWRIPYFIRDFYHAFPRTKTYLKKTHFCTAFFIAFL